MSQQKVGGESVAPTSWKNYKPTCKPIGAASCVCWSTLDTLLKAIYNLFCSSVGKKLCTSGGFQSLISQNRTQDAVHAHYYLSKSFGCKERSKRVKGQTPQGHMR
uniref:Uncharacterized protein n=1 Tax=Kalanchoe fedtschenkoi TaxID=63787 RepID=A0A7N0SZW9_KALFE